MRSRYLSYPQQDDNKKSYRAPASAVRVHTKSIHSAIEHLPGEGGVWGGGQKPS